MRFHFKCAIILFILKIYDLRLIKGNMNKVKSFYHKNNFSTTIGKTLISVDFLQNCSAEKMRRNFKIYNKLKQGKDRFMHQRHFKSDNTSVPYSHWGSHVLITSFFCSMQRWYKYTGLLVSESFSRNKNNPLGKTNGQQKY